MKFFNPDILTEDQLISRIDRKYMEPPILVSREINAEGPVLDAARHWRSGAHFANPALLIKGEIYTEARPRVVVRRYIRHGNAYTQPANHHPPLSSTKVRSCRGLCFRLQNYSGLHGVLNRNLCAKRWTSDCSAVQVVPKYEGSSTGDMFVDHAEALMDFCENSCL